VLADPETDKLAGFWRDARDAKDGFGELITGDWELAIFVCYLLSMEEIGAR
jgi:hypothetical protein